MHGKYEGTTANWHRETHSPVHAREILNAIQEAPERNPLTRACTGNTQMFLRKEVRNHHSPVHAREIHYN